MTLSNMLRRSIVGVGLTIGMAIVPVGGVAQGVSPFGGATSPAGEATPVAAASVTWEIVETREIEVEGMPVALSPDGQWIAGTGRDWELCVWEIETLEPTCAEPGNYQVDPEALVWSPDSRAVAFTQDTARRLIDSELYVFELETGQLGNLTDDGFDGRLPLNPEHGEPVPVLIDLGPTWAPDSQSIAFGRSFWTAEERGAQQPQILRIDRAGGEPQVLAELTTESPWGVMYPMFEVAGGTLVFAISPADPNNPNEGIWMLEAGGEPIQIVAGTGLADFPYARAVDATDSPDGVLISGWSISLAGQGMGLEPYAFVANAESGDVVTLGPGMTPVRFGPDGVSTIAIVVEGNDGVLTVTAPDGEVSSMGPVPRSRFEQTRGLDWASNNTVFLCSGLSSGHLVTLAPVAA
jgi:Tol biopolymer transport system component